MHHILEIDDERIEIPFDKDGYIYATAICKRINKFLQNYIRLKETKNLIELIHKEYDAPFDEIIMTRKGGNNKTEQGTWIHRELVLHFASWCSPYFTLQANKWIEEWLHFKHENQDRYYKELYNMRPYLTESETKEKLIQIKLQKQLGGEIEVETENGWIDLLTDSEIIEIKDGKCWKHAVGQILMYALDYPNHQKRIHLFDIGSNQQIDKSCNVYDIIVTYES